LRLRLHQLILILVVRWMLMHPLPILMLEVLALVAKLEAEVVLVLVEMSNLKNQKLTLILKNQVLILTLISRSQSSTLVVALVDLVLAENWEEILKLKNQRSMSILPNLSLILEVVLILKSQA